MSISDTPTPQRSTGPIRKKTNSLLNAAVLKVLLSAIAEVPRSKDELVEITGLQRTTVCRWINLLHVRKGEINNLVYVEDWGRSGQKRHPVALWKLGYGMYDKPKPIPKPMKQSCKEWRLKQKIGTKVTQTDKGIIHELR